MSLPEIVNQDTWIRARAALLDREKAQTRARDELAAERRRRRRSGDRTRRVVATVARPCGEG
jgi:predicted dithiol-disulfide oxidoreductase (DUF899 family)